MNNAINHLTLSWSISRARDTYGYDVCLLDDRLTGKRYRCNGGGYDMIGTVFGEWLQDVYQKELSALLQSKPYELGQYGTCAAAKSHPEFYGAVLNTANGQVSLDGACGIESMIRLAEAIGLEVEEEWNKWTGRRLGWFVQKRDSE